MDEKQEIILEVDELGLIRTKGEGDLAKDLGIPQEHKSWITNLIASEMAREILFPDPSFNVLYTVKRIATQAKEKGLNEVELLVLGLQLGAFIQRMKKE